jgi:hypothetical protein
MACLKDQIQAKLDEIEARNKLSSNQAAYDRYMKLSVQDRPHTEEEKIECSLLGATIGSDMALPIYLKSLLRKL